VTRSNLYLHQETLWALINIFSDPTMKIIARVYIVRHGETAENLQKIIQGQQDTVLSETGIKQAHSVSEALKSIPFDVAFSSDLSRATKTAEAILTYHPAVKLFKQEALRERHMGAMQGIVWTPGSTRWTDSDPTAEHSAAFIARIVRWWDTELQTSIENLTAERKEACHILAMTHGGVVDTLVRKLIQRGTVKLGQGVFIMSCKNTAITVIEFEEDGTKTVVKYGDASHLIEKTMETNADVDLE